MNKNEVKRSLDEVTDARNHLQKASKNKTRRDSAEEDKEETRPFLPFIELIGRHESTLCSIGLVKDEGFVLYLYEQVNEDLKEVVMDQIDHKSTTCQELAHT